MQWQSWKLALIVALGSVLMGGCANFKWKGGENSLGSTSTDNAAAKADIARAKEGEIAREDEIARAKADEIALADKKANQPENKFERQFAWARLCELRGQNEVAEPVYRELLKTAPKDARLYHRLGVLELQKGEFAQAEENFSKATSLAPPNAELLSDVGYCFYLQQKLPEAEKTLKEALKIDSSHKTAINNLALVVGSQGRYQESKELFLRNNTEAEACANLGYVLAQKGETAKAKEMYLRALTLDNKMQVAAKAMLQIDEREKAMVRLASTGSKQHPVSTQNAEELEIIDLPQKDQSNHKAVGEVKEMDVEESSQTVTTVGIVGNRSS